MTSLTRWTWVWVNSTRWWWTGRPGVLWFMGSQRVGHDWMTELNWTELNWTTLQAFYCGFPERNWILPSRLTKPLLSLFCYKETWSYKFRCFILILTLTTRYTFHLCLVNFPSHSPHSISLSYPCSLFLTLAWLCSELRGNSDFSYQRKESSLERHLQVPHSSPLGDDVFHFHFQSQKNLSPYTGSCIEKSISWNVLFVFFNTCKYTCNLNSQSTCLCLS